MHFLLKSLRNKIQFKSERKLIDREISKSKRFGHKFSLLAIELSHSVPRGISKILPGKAISFHVLEKNLRLYDQLINTSFRKYYLLLPLTDEQEVEAVTKRIRGLAQQHHWGDIAIHCATYPQDGDTSKALLDKLS